MSSIARQTSSYATTLAPTPSNEYRSWKLDFARGLAVLFMIAFHFLFDLSFLTQADIRVHFQIPGIWWRIASSFIGGFFLFISGMSTWLQSRTPGGPSATFRSGKIFLAAAAVSSFSLWLMPRTPVYFGILHCLWLSNVLALCFIRRRALCVAAATTAVALGIYLRIQRPTLSMVWLLWLGIKPTPPFPMGDYYPLLPWFGVVLFGVLAGQRFYPDNGITLFSPQPNHRFLKYMTLIGRNSLPIYLAHQPFLIAVLYLLGIHR